MAKGMEIEELQVRLKELEAEPMSLNASAELDRSGGLEELGTVSGRRAKSVPVHRLGDRLGAKEEVAARNIHTSPALISLERVMQVGYEFLYSNNMVFIKVFIYIDVKHIICPQ